MIALVLNVGSSTLKAALFDLGRDRGDVRERELFRATEPFGGPAGAASVEHALDAMVRRLDAGALPRPTCAGHRIVHGGPSHEAPAKVDRALLADLRDLVPLSPLHLPLEIAAIEAVDRALAVPQVVCFDTAFHHHMSEVATRFALPEDLFASGVRRYGFHGLSYEHVVDTVGARALGRAVLAHLGNGASMAAVRGGRSIDTTMGMTPTGGLVMGTRSGDLDPGVLVWLLRHGYDVDGLERLVDREAGLLALSGETSDMKALLARTGSDHAAALAVESFVYHASKWACALTAALGGIDSLVFTGGVGENAAPIRAGITRRLAHLGVALDEPRNARNEAIISADGSPCVVRVVRADEERVIARHVRRLLST